MLRSEKVEEIKVIKERVSQAKATIVAEYRGLNVAQMTDLRSQLRGVEGGLRVVKNRLAKRAFSSVSMEQLNEQMVGPTAIATSVSDPVSLAKTLVDFANKNKQLVIKAGMVEGKVVNLPDITAIAALPSREVLLGQLLSAMQGVARNTVSVLAAVPRGLVNVLKAIGDNKSA